MFRPDKRTIAEHEIKVLLGQPKTYPAELVDALGRLSPRRKTSSAPGLHTSSCLTTPEADIH
jgi:hypothetical protein